MSAFIDLTGKRFGRLTVLRRGQTIGIVIHWLCKCDCGKEKQVPGYSMRNGTSRSCGCLQRELIGERSRLNKPWPLEERTLDFWKQVNKTSANGCWLWGGRQNNTGYGWFHYMKKAILAHRFSWFLHIGKMPSRFVLHKCDTPLCVNPNHLFEGTARDNAHDKMAKGRQPKTLPGACKINDDMVRLLRSRWIPYKVSMAKLAKEFRLNVRTVMSAIYKRKGVV